jgi:hypothetical protein
MLFVTRFLNFYSKCLNKEALEGFGDLKIVGQVIHSMKYVDDFVLLSKEEWCYST